MKQIAARLEDEFVKKLKQYSLDNDISMQEIIKQALTSYLDNKLTSQQSNKITSVNVNKLTNTQVNKMESYNDNLLTRQQVNKKTFEEMYGYDDSDATEEELEEARATTVYVDEAPIPVYIEETPIISTYDNRPLSLDDLVPEKPKPKKESKYR